MSYIISWSIYYLMQEEDLVSHSDKISILDGCFIILVNSQTRKPVFKVHGLVDWAHFLSVR